MTGSQHRSHRFPRKMRQARLLADMSNENKEKAKSAKEKHVAAFHNIKQVYEGIKKRQDDKK
ncbi:MAG: hypothetical protein P0107_05680, partial [Nitrosomonas sp.]|nr:hypothetical protein [Nitrosomonas sp.]